MRSTHVADLLRNPNGPAKWVAFWLLANLAAVGAFDLVATFRKEEFETVSSYIQMWSGRWPIIAFGAGMIAGHLWFR
jgi:hypothetical protein